MKKRLLCLPAAPFLMSSIIPLGFIFLLWLVGYFVYLILKRLKMKKDKRGNDASFWKLSVFMLAFIAFVASFFFFHSSSSYLLAYVSTFAVLLIGFALIKKFSLAEIKKATFLILILLTLIFIVLYALKVSSFSFGRPPTSTGPAKGGFNPPSTSGSFPKSIPLSTGSGCGDSLFF